MRLCLDPNLRQQMGRSAREASSVYSIERTTRIMLEQYERILHDDAPNKNNLDTRLRSILERFLSS